jgi:hypothetical protein
MDKKSKQIVVLKGAAGFCDRLQVLSYCVQYCLKNDAMLCVDWRDNFWGQGKLDFSDYFDLIDIETISLNDVLNKINNETKIYPAAWNYDEIKSVPNNTHDFNRFVLKFDKELEKIDADVLVNNGHGDRTWFFENIVHNIKFKPDITEIIVNRIKNIKLPYTVVHLRGTDRLNNVSITESIKPGIENFEKLAPYNKSSVYLISDMKGLVDAWREKYPDSMLVLDDYASFKIDNVENKGTHMLEKRVLNFYKVTKHELNLDTLTDFVIMAFSDCSVGNNKDSYFTLMAKKLSTYGVNGISKWLNGYIPDET